MRKLRGRYGLIKLPFTKDVPIDELYAFPARDATLTRLKAAVRGRSCAVLTGEPGTGKTFVLRALEDQLASSRFRVTYIHNSTVNLRDFYRQLSMLLGLEPRATPSALFRTIRNNIEEVSSQKIHPVLLLDEAHLSPVEVLGHLHILLNFDRDSKPLLSVLLVGLPGLRDRLARNALASLASRLPVRAVLEPLSVEQTGEYVVHRLRAAGCEEDVFSEEAVLLTAEATGGVMRKIDVLAATSLEVACSGKNKLIDGAVVQEAVKLCAEALV